jgi:hypothetical protein
MSNAPSVPIPFALAEVVWHAGYGQHSEWSTCPECCGSKTITLTQGNGDQVSLDCACCSRGFNPPTGTIERRVSNRRPVPFICAWVEVRGEEIRYMENTTGSGTIVDSKDLFRDQNACQQRCDELNKLFEEEQERLILATISHKRKDMAWSAHYWGRKVKDLERELELAKKRLGLIKSSVGGRKREEFGT